MYSVGVQTRSRPDDNVKYADRTGGQTDMTCKYIGQVDRTHKCIGQTSRHIEQGRAYKPADILTRH